jgi:TetR/AcrR family tetracycline transcriptional repressor
VWAVLRVSDASFMTKRSKEGEPRPRLDLDRVVEGALGLLDDEGLDGVTTRRLAARLGVQSPALYWYIRDKGELLDLLGEAVCAGADEAFRALAAEAGLDWRERLEAALRLHREFLVRHRDAPRLLAARPPTGPNRLRHWDALVGCLLDAGFAEADAARLAVLLAGWTTSAVADETGRMDVPVGLEEGADDYPNLARIAAERAQGRGEGLFEIGLEVLLDGVGRRLNPPA